MADKFIRNNAGALQELEALVVSAGAGSAGRIPALDASGRLDSTVMPAGIGADTATMLASEAIAAGDFINVWNDAGAFKIRKADATTSGKQADGFVLSAISSGASGTVYFEGPNTAVTGLTPGIRYLATTAGASTATAPSAAGQVVQRIGIAVSATVLNFEPQTPIVLA